MVSGRGLNLFGFPRQPNLHKTGPIPYMKITDYLAIYAAVLSTLVFAWNVAQSRPRFRVDLVHGLETLNGKTEDGVYIIVRNVSNHDIHLANERKWGQTLLNNRKN